LGDIFEMWTASFEDAVVAARYFFAALGALAPRRIVLVPGNHDHHLLVQHREELRRDALLANGALPAPSPVQQTFQSSYLAELLPAELRDRLLVAYPNYRLELDGCRVVFHHGHHLATLRGGDIFALAPRFILEHIERRPRDALTLSELERGSHIFFEVSYVLGASAGVRTRLLEFWGRLVGWNALLQSARSLVVTLTGHRNLALNRGTALWNVENFREPARRYLRLMAEDTAQPWPADVLVFGHTHRQGIAAVQPRAGTEERVMEALLGDLEPILQGPDPGGQDFHLVNTGCWLREADKPNEGHIDILADIRDGRLTLAQLDGTRLEPVAVLPLARLP
jgi:UDP-2,3-diacylglucosamine pyrophosphatase LpxH